MISCLPSLVRCRFDTRAIHGHLYNAFMHARNVTIIAIFKLKAFIAVSTSVSLMTCFSLAIFNDIRRLFAVNTRQLNNSHALLLKLVAYQINSFKSLPNIHEQTFNYL